MPVPTDTLYNIKRLNVLFAISAVALAGTVIWSILQDYGKDWHTPQQNARVWEAAIVDAKIRATESSDAFKMGEASLKAEQEKLEANKAELSAADAEISKIKSEITRINDEISPLEFKYNSSKAVLTVDESHLQDAITEGNQAEAKKLSEEILEPRKKLAEMAEKLASLKTQVSDNTAKLKVLNKTRDDLASKKAKLEGDLDLMKKKRESLAPSSIAGKVSTEIRSAPLMGFINPADKVQQIVLTDVQADLAVLKVPMTDRCTTCHINIAKKDFQLDNVLAFLEAQASTVRQQVLPEVPASGSAPAATRLKPGPVALPEFWHIWASKLAPELVKKPAFANRIKTFVGGIDKLKGSITIDSKPANNFNFDPDSKDATGHVVVTEVIKALAAYSPAAELSTGSGNVKITLPKGIEASALTPIRTAAFKYVEDLRAQLPTLLTNDQAKQLIEKYRCALITETNIGRKANGDKLLDYSPVVLAHPRLDLYVDTDSKHNMEVVGCTSCHDGSGQETDFVLAAHRSRPIWVDEKTGQPVLAQQIDFSKAHEGEHAEHKGHSLSSMYGAIYPEGKITPAGADSLYLPGQLKEEAHASTEAPEKLKLDAPEESEPLPYVDPITGKAGKAVPQFKHWQEKYEPSAPRNFELVYHEWDRPMLPGRYLQANCTRCHTEVYDIKDTAPVLYEGRALFTRLGCVNCHQMDSVLPTQNRKVGTDLSHVGSKLSPAFINTWVWAPKAFRPTTKMPHFFMLENNSSNEEIRRTRQEARAITEYIVQTSEKLPPAAVKPSSVKGSVESGRAIFNSIGCQGCHSNLNETGEKWITDDLVKRAGMKTDEAKAAYSKMTYNERHLYVRENLEAPEGVLPALPKYADGTPKPVFIHHGPELSGVGTKLLSGRTDEEARTWLFDWLKQPRHYSSYTMMPNLRLDDQQAADLMEYILAQKRTVSDPNDKWQANLTEADAGKLREMTALFLLARYSKDVAFERATRSEELDPLATDALTTPQIDAKSAAERVKSMSIEQKQMVFLGKKLIAHYGCMGCHKINGTETITSACANLSDWGQKSPDKLAFGYVTEHKLHELPPTHTLNMVNGFSVAASALTGSGSENVAKPFDVTWPVIGHNRSVWLEQKLKNPRIWDRGQQLLEPNSETKESGKPYDKVKMPSFYLNDEEVRSIATFVLSNRDRLVTDTMVNRATHDRAKTIARGRELVERFNCIGCHQTELNQPQVQQWFKTEEIIDKAPPSLRGEGNKIQHAWLFNFFKNVHQLRPLMFNGFRMPSFPATDDEWTAIVAYFNAISNKEADYLKGLLDSIQKYTDAAVKAAVAKDPTALTKLKPGEVSPGDDWWQQPTLKNTADELKNWALARTQIKDVEVDATKMPPAALMKGYRTILFKAKFTEGLYRSAYPFVDSPRPVVSDEKLKLGESLFQEMQCLSCHRLGDENAPGAVKDPKGPNLSFVATRLQRRWVRHWVQEPPIIQVGTKMPQFFSGLPVFQLNGQDWASANGLAPAKIDDTKKKYGATADEQTQLILDFLYNAGVKGVTSVQPAAPAAK